MRICSLVFILFFAQLSRIVAQDKSIRIEATNQSSVDFITQLEQRTDYRFFFNPSSIDTLLISGIYSVKI